VSVFAGLDHVHVVANETQVLLYGVLGHQGAAVLAQRLPGRAHVVVAV